MRRLPPIPLWKDVTVLVIEDHRDSRELLRQMLHALGLRVLAARDGQEALDHLGETTPDLILCDLVMPVMDGFAFLSAIRRSPRYQRIPVVAVTALGQDHDLDATWRAGFDGHLTKPIDYDTVVATVERILGQRLGAKSTEEEDVD
jgi:CheY-like chemotaxis protein